MKPVRTLLKFSVTALSMAFPAYGVSVNSLDLSAHRWCYLQPGDDWIHTMKLSPSGTAINERCANTTPACRDMSFEGRWKLDQQAVLSLTFRTTYRSIASMGEDKQRLTLTMIEPRKGQILTLVQCDRDILPSKDLPPPKPS